MKKTGLIAKMRGIVNLESAKLVQYSFVLDDEEIPLNECIGQSIKLSFAGKIVCAGCAKTIKKSYQNGYCFQCTQTLAECDSCILSPEKCHFAKGTCRDEEWGKKHCMIDHYVYLANTSGVKVGITRHTQIPTRWIDQGATQAILIFKVSQRYYSGLVETLFKNTVADKTNWRVMLKGEAEKVDLAEIRDQLFEEFGESIDHYEQELGEENFEILEDEKMAQIHYPVDVYPQQVASLSLDKKPEISGKLQGIKGQYLILDKGVINIRKHSNYHITFEY